MSWPPHRPDEPPPFWAQAGADALLAEGPDDLAALLPWAGSVVVDDCASARELRDLGFGTDVDLALAVDADPFACVLLPDGTIGRGPAADRR